MFQVGKKVICIKVPTSVSFFTLGEVHVVLGIKEYRGCVLLNLHITGKSTVFDNNNSPLGGEFYDSRFFAPYDDELSDVSVNELLEELFPEPEPQPVSHILQNEFERLKQLIQTYNELADLSHDNGRYDLMTSYVMEIQAVNDAMADFTDLFTLNRDN